MAGTQTQPQPMFSGPNEAQVLDVSLQKEFSERQSDRAVVDLFRFREKCAPQTECGPLQRVNVALKCGVVSLCRLGNFVC